MQVHETFFTERLIFRLISKNIVWESYFQVYGLWFLSCQPPYRVFKVSGGSSSIMPAPVIAKYSRMVVLRSARKV